MRGMDGTISVHAYGDELAPYFDGKFSFITIDPKGNEFDFGLSGFTVEAWVCTTSGGEIVSSCPSATNDKVHQYI